MAEMSDHHTCSSPPPPPSSPVAPSHPRPSLVESDEISIFLHQLLYSSTSLCMSSDRDKQKSFPSARLPPPLFSSSLQITSTATFYESLPESHLRSCGSAFLSASDCRTRDGSSTAESSTVVESKKKGLRWKKRDLREEEKIFSVLGLFLIRSESLRAPSWAEQRSMGWDCFLYEVSLFTFSLSYSRS
ncbi:hypothetical protein NE237_006403 [Protea cynaroides]|uniref:Uncharacterized protein n=1 Tax=Protea cynaroides TaxID=273540 RepID=A0A9Q0QVH5_9MAGN|nr:hypothetical protein NE237_006403 [Protea cynaroides]